MTDLAPKGPPIQVLDHGYVQLIESWGCDERIIESARVSTQGGFVSWDPYEGHPKGDAGLLAYLWKNKHSTPFEFAGMTLEIQAPIAVFREWHRSRTQCLSGDTLITCATPNTDSTFKRTIKEIFDLKHGGVVDSAPLKHRNGFSKIGTPVWRAARRADPWRTRKLPICQHRLLRVLDESTGLFGVAPMRDVWESGVKKLYAVKAGDFLVKASADHPFYTKRGWVKTSQLVVGDEIARMGKVAARERPIPPVLRKAIGVWTSMMRIRVLGTNPQACYLCAQQFSVDDLQLDHVIPVNADLKKALDTDNLKPVCRICHRTKTSTEQTNRDGFTRRGIRWERLNELPHFVGEEMTYDLEVLGDNHNYCANDLVVHNSYSEMSARYMPIPDVNYLPTVERCMVVNGANRQANAVEGADVLTHESALEWLEQLADYYERGERLYQDGLRRGIPKEVARMGMPVGRYSRMRATANLRNWLGFLTLRSDHVPAGKAAQMEIRQFANVVGDLTAQIFPRTYNLFVA